MAHGYSKSLVFLFIPLLAVPLWLFFYRQRHYFVEWLMLSTYLFAGMLLVYAVAALLMLALFFASLVPQTINQDGFLSVVMAVLTTSYAALFFRGAFPRQLWPLRWGKALAFTLSFAVALLIPYRFVLFLVCYWVAA